MSSFAMPDREWALMQIGTTQAAGILLPNQNLPIGDFLKSGMLRTIPFNEPDPIKYYWIYME